MELILHPGAHRTGSTSFQSYLRCRDAELAGLGVGFWGPWRTRNGLFHGVFDPVLQGPASDGRRAAGRLRLGVEAAARRGLSALIVSDENMIGSPRACLRARRLYPEAGARLACLGRAFGRIDRVVLQIRSPEMWWASALAFLLGRGTRMPDAAVLDALVAGGGNWRAVITAAARALPGCELVVTPFERFASRPDRLLKHATGLRFAPALPPGGIWAHRSPGLEELRALLEQQGEDATGLPGGDGRWMPFSTAQAARLRESYADDLFWLRAGADGLARLIEEPEPERRQQSAPRATRRRGLDDDSQEGRLVQSR